MNIYKLTFGGGQYEDRWDYSIIFSSFENAKKALYEQFFKKTGYDKRAWWNIKEGIIDTEEWTTLVEGSIVENHNHDEDGYPIGNEATVTLYTEKKELRGKRLIPIRYRRRDREKDYSTETATHKEVDNWVIVETPIIIARLSYREYNQIEKVELERINEITL